MPDTKKRIIRTAFFIALITVVVYLPSLFNDFVNWDDNEYVYDNPHIRILNVQFIKWMFTSFHSSNWHPLTWLSHSLDYAFWGLTPLGHHLTSIVLHGLNTFLVFILTISLINLAISKKQDPGKFEGNFLLDFERFLPAAATTAILFGLHPLHVESVAWISERKDLLCAFFFLLSLRLYLNYVSNHQPGKKMKLYGSSLGFFLLALMSKPMAVTLPAVLLLLDVYPLQRINLRPAQSSLRRILIEKLPFFGLSMGTILLTLLAHKSAMPSMELFPLSVRILVAVRAIGFYLVKMVFPFKLAPLYPYPADISFGAPGIILSFLTISGFTFFCIRAWLKNQKFWGAASLFFLVTLLPVLGIIQVGEQAAADRYTYLPSLGPFLLIGLGVAFLNQGLSIQLKIKRLWIRFVLLGIILVPASLITVKQISVWKDSLSLWNAVLKVYPTSYRAYFTRGNYYYEKGLLKEALVNNDKTVTFSPRLARG